jgi:signal transduction histidine kinase
MLPVLIDQANKSLNKLSLLIGDLLNTTKMTEGQLQLNKSQVTLSALIEECSQYVHTEAGHRILIKGDTDLQVYADADKVEQVIINFVNNVIKYAPESKEIVICVERENHMAKVMVIDKGPGISPEKLPNLFDRYYRVDNSGIQYSGLGLGLYICAEIIKKHNGQIGAESQLGEGSTFWFTLPIF